MYPEESGRGQRNPPETGGRPWQAQVAFNTWSQFDTSRSTTDVLLDMLDFDFFEVLDSLTIARSREHITNYYDITAIGQFLAGCDAGCLYQPETACEKPYADFEHDNILNTDEKDLEYRKIQLQKLKEEVIDLEDLREGVSITDLGLNDSQMDLTNLVKIYKDASNVPVDN